MTAQRSKRRPAKWNSLFAVAAFSALALGLLLYELGTRSMWGDEGASYAIASQHGQALFSGIARDGGNLALYYLILHVVIELFGTGEVVLRLFSVLCSVATVPALYFAGRRLFDERTGLFAALLGAVSAPLVLWGQMARGYTLAALLACLSATALVRALSSRRPSAFVLYGLLAAALCWTEILATLAVVAQLIYLVLAVRPKRMWRTIVVTYAAIAVALVPLAVLVHRRGSAQLGWLEVPKDNDLRAVWAFMSSARSIGYTASTSHLLSVLTFALMLSVLALVLVSLVSRQWTFAWQPVVLVGLWALFPVTVAYIISKNIQPVFVDRYFTFCVPAISLLIAAPLARIQLWPLAVVSISLLSVVRFFQIPPSYGDPIDNFQQAVNHVLSISEKGDCIAFYSNDTFVDFDYYLHHRSSEQLVADGPTPRSVLPALSWSSDPVIIEEDNTLSKEALRRVTASCNRVFLMAAHTGHPYGTPQAASVYRRFQALEASLRRAYPFETVTKVQGVVTDLFSSPYRTAAVIR